MKNFIFYLLVIAGLNICFFPESFAEEKIKAEKENKLLNIPDWMNLYTDLGYVYGENYHFRTNRVTVVGRNYYDLTIGANILYNFKNIPLFFNLNISNLYDGLKSKSKLVFFTTYESNPFFAFSLGSGISNSSSMFNTAISYSRNFKSNNILRNYSFSASLSRLYKNFTITAVGSYKRKYSDYYFSNSVRKINAKITSVELNLSYNYKYITPYISLYDEIFSKPSYEYTTEKKSLIFKTGIYISTSEIFSGFRSISKNIFPKSYGVYFVGVKKPNIYLYPEKDKTVKVKLNRKNNSKITESIPEYNDGWNVFVQKNGRIDEKYDYLFYEGDITKPKNLKRGWCVEKKDIISFFEKILYEYGFNINEINDFIEYWSTHLPDGKYYEVYPIVDSEIDKYFSLEISPKPDSIKRLWFYVLPASSMKNLNLPEVKKFLREGFTVAEWGVILK